MSDPKPRRPRVILCMGDDCNAEGRATPFFERLKEVLGAPTTFGSQAPIKFEISTCLDHCEEGPNMVMYPNPCWFHHLDMATLETAIAEKILPILQGEDSPAH